MFELRKYCEKHSTLDSTLFKVSALIFLAVFAVLGLIMLITSGGSGILKQAFCVFGILTLVFGIYYFMCPEVQLTRKMSKIFRSGLADELVRDFKESKPFYNDSVRVGSKYIFSKGTNVIMEIAEIKKLYRVFDKNTLQYYAEQSDFIFKRKLFLIDTSIVKDGTDEVLWKLFGENLKMRCPEIKVLEKVKIIKVRESHGKRITRKRLRRH